MTTDQTQAGEDLRPDEEATARLLRLAGPRHDIPADIEARVYKQVHGEWRTSTDQRDGSKVYGAVHHEWKKGVNRPRFRHWLLPFALAASVVLAVVVLLQPEPLPPMSVGTIARVNGNSPEPGAAAVGDPVYVGDTLTTGGEQGLSLLLSRSESLRIAANSVVRVEAGDRFALIQGRIYADTGQFVYRDGGLHIETAIGSVRDVGTQFAVSLDAGSLDVAVREGRVDVLRNQESFVAIAGERMKVALAGKPSTGNIAASDDYWDWASALAPSYNSENRSIMAILKWAARETGRELVIHDDDLRMSALRITINESLEGFAPDEALRTALAVTDLRYRISSDQIIIER